MSLTDLQIACLELWRSNDPDSLIRDVKAEGLIERRLSGALGTLGTDLQDAAIALLSLMVTPDGLRNRISEVDAIGRIVEAEPSASSERLQRALAELVKTRLVREEVQDNAIYYEIVSEFLAPWIARVRRQRESNLTCSRNELPGALGSGFWFCCWSPRLRLLSQSGAPLKPSAGNKRLRRNGKGSETDKTHSKKRRQS
ncbi:hypothetical protein SBA6_410076 [Candidatus Sulfopaludibacter sp. SbA6]|nr:hypothetical protein SBA6_410076 [Candidatus Sulfopaludibacter sp. SbA6]